MPMPDLSFTQIKETILYVEDLRRTRAFYHERLGLPLIHFKEGDHVFFRAGSSVLLCFLAESTRNKTEIPPHYGAGELHLAFECRAEQYEGWKAKVEGEGVEIEQEYDWGGGRRSFYFRDPDRHLLEVVQPGIWGD